MVSEQRRSLGRAQVYREVCEFDCQEAWKLTVKEVRLCRVLR
jgi:hypothetical protein